MLEQLLAQQARAVNPPAPRRESGPRPHFRCVACGHESHSLNGAEDHSDEARHHRFEQVFR